MSRSRIASAAGALAVVLGGGGACADDAPAASVVLPPVVVTALPEPTIGDQPSVRTLDASTIATDGWASAAGAMLARIGAVNVQDDLDDPEQPSLFYRGFEASPVLGASEGLAVYQGGVRVNEAFGDVVNWDLIPDNAIARLDVASANPLYGENALGGAIVLRMKNGFDDPGGAADVTGGSFGLRAGEVSYGGHSDRFAVFLAARALDEDGWREFSSDRVRQLYADVAARGDRLTLDLSFSGADNLLEGESATPVEELAVDRRLVFTSPQDNANRLAFLTLNGAFQASPTLSLQGDAYVRGFDQGVENGNTTAYVACTTPPGQLCQPDGLTPLATASGAPIPDISQGGAVPIGENDRERIDARSAGGRLQAVSSSPLLDRGNQAAFGATLDASHVDFFTSTEVGVIAPDLVVQPSGLFPVTPEGSPFNATPVDLGAEIASAGAYGTDTLALGGHLSLSLSARFNWTRIALHDRLGVQLTGTNDYQRLNPAIGLVWKPSEALSLYGDYAEGSRAPTPSEIECSDPARPCLLPSSLSSDPPALKQVVSRTFEVGLKGRRSLGSGDLEYSLSAYRTQVRDDIYGVATSLSAGFFENIPGTTRAGVEADLTYRTARLTALASYAYTDATFDSALTLPSPANPFRDADGNIHVHPGDILPGIPRNRLKLVADYHATARLSFGGEARFLDSQFYHGDESNQLAPIPGYVVVGLHASYAPTAGWRLFARVDNALNARYATFGVLGDPSGIGAPGVPNDGANPRFLSPAAPLAVTLGVEARL
ncbi:MAG TPA: TonB-dependent receptor [Caulobacteraceae bacterium]|nr:TonB-dependent receptor [Caulobacteraceae bacterium]